MENEDEDFGDFNDIKDGQTDEDFGDFSAPVDDKDLPVQEPQNHIFAVEDIPGNESEESRLFKCAVTIPPQLDVFKKYWPIRREVIDNPDAGVPLLENTGPKELIKFTPKFATGNFHETFLKCQNDTIYTEESFRWRKSLIRAAFLESISAVAVEKKKSSAVPAKKSVVEAKKPLEETFVLTTNESTNATIDSREQELISAKKLCDIPEEDIRKKSKQEIREMIAELNSSLIKIQEQANYWLDAKEQLVMESEMHNKMIASLVSYAQQKEKGAKKK